jgi:hypothetical protein
VGDEPVVDVERGQNQRQLLREPPDDEGPRVRPHPIRDAVTAAGQATEIQPFMP